MQEFPVKEIVWRAPEFEHRPKTQTWYWTTIGISILLLALAVWQKNYFFALFVIIAELMVIFWGSYEPPMIKFKLNSKGLTIGGTKFYPFTDIKKWSADSEGVIDARWPDIILHLDQRFHTGLKIKAPHVLLPEIEEALRATPATEVPYEPTTIDLLEKIIGF